MLYFNYTCKVRICLLLNTDYILKKSFLIFCTAGADAPHPVREETIFTSAPAKEKSEKMKQRTNVLFTPPTHHAAP